MFKSQQERAKDLARDMSRLASGGNIFRKTYKPSESRGMGHQSKSSNKKRAEASGSGSGGGGSSVGKSRGGVVGVVGGGKGSKLREREREDEDKEKAPTRMKMRSSASARASGSSGSKGKGLGSRSGLSISESGLGVRNLYSKTRHGPGRGAHCQANAATEFALSGAKAVDRSKECLLLRSKFTGSASAPYPRSTQVSLRLMFKGLLLYTVVVMFHVECYI